MLDLAERCHHLDATAVAAEPITIAAFGSAVAEVVAPALAALAPGAVVVRGVDDEAALRELRLGTADVAVVQEYDHQPIGRSGRCDYVELARDELRLVVPTTVRPEHDDSRDLGRHTVAAERRRQPLLGARVLRLLADAGVRPRVAGTVEDNHALLRLVAAGHGAGIVPALVLAGGAAGATVADTDLGAARTILAVTRRSSGDRCDAVVAALAAAVGRR